MDEYPLYLSFWATHQVSWATVNIVTLMSHTFPIITWKCHMPWNVPHSHMEMPHSLWNNATQSWNVMEQCHTAMECHGTMPHNLQNLVEPSTQPHGTWQNILLHIMEPYGTFHYYWRNLMELAGTCWNIVEYLYLELPNVYIRTSEVTEIDNITQPITYLCLVKSCTQSLYISLSSDFVDSQLHGIGLVT